MRGSIRSVVVVCGVVVGVLLTGCASKNEGQGTATTESKKAVSGLKETRQELVKAKTEVNDAVAALDKLSAGTNLPQSYKEYSTAVSDVQAAGDRARTRAQAMRENGREYVAKWEKEMDQISSPELRAGAADRRQKVKAHYDEVVNVGRSVREAYQPFLKDLQDIQRALANDLTPGGVSAAQAAITKAKAEGATLNERIDALIAKLDEISGGMSSTAAAQQSPSQAQQSPSQAQQSPSQAK